MSAKGVLELVVAGAHLTGLPLNHQLTELGAKLMRSCRTAPVYRMYSLGPKPSLIRQPAAQSGGCEPIEVEIWAVPIEKVGEFLRDGVKGPLAIGDVLLEDGQVVKGFVGEAYGVEGAEDITHKGGWRAHVKSQQQKQS